MDQQQARLRFLYLHGFASSPASQKAQFFAGKLAAEGIEAEILALDGGHFETLTITGQLELIEQTAGQDDVVLIGSSMGGYVAALYAARHTNVRGLVLLVPAFGFLDLWRRRLGPAGFDRWREEGTMQVFHYGLGRETALRFDLMRDAEKYEPVPEFAAPALIFHGNRDDVVPVQSSEDFARSHSTVQLVRLEAGHEMTEVLGSIWQRAWPLFEALWLGFGC